jgi:hypothetical protein
MHAHDICDLFPREVLAPQPMRLLAQQFERFLGKGAGVLFCHAAILTHLLFNCRVNNVHVDDAYLDGERPGKPGRGSPNKVSFVAAVQIDAQGNPQYAKLAPVPGFTSRAIADWARYIGRICAL